MELTPELLLEAKFAPARRGYDMAEVDDFLERCAEGLDVLLARLRAEFERAEQADAAVAELRRELDAMGGAPAGGPPTVAVPVVEPEPDSEPEASPFVAEPAPVAESVPTKAPAVDEPMRILIHAERTAEAAIADARAEAERIRAEAEAIASTQRNEAEALLASAKADAEVEARRAGEEARRAMQTEVTTLRRDRDSLSDDIRNLRRWLDDQRGRMRTTARELQRLVEDPSTLRELPLPEISETSALADGSADPTEGGGDPAAPADDASDVVDVEQVAATDESDDTDIDLSTSSGEPTQAVPVARRIWPYDDDVEADDAAAGPPR